MKVGLISVQVEFDGLYLGQVAMLRVLICVTVRPGTYQEQLERRRLISEHTHNASGTRLIPDMQVSNV